MLGYQVSSEKTLLAIMWEELDSVVERLMAGAEAEDGRDPGRAEGVAYCIAVLTHSPGKVDMEAIRQEAMERWECVHGKG